MQGWQLAYCYMSQSEKILWSVFGLLIFVVVIKIISALIGLHLDQQLPWLQYLFLTLPVILLILHATISLGWKKGLLFALLASTVGTYFEHIGLRDGTFFGGQYIYHAQNTLFNVPISVILFWAVFIYTGYCLTNSFLLWLKVKKPQHKLHNFWLIPILVIMDGYLVVAIDFFMDPIAVQSGSWQWLSGGSYFGIPWGNFVGWFVVAIIVTGIFRIMEYFLNSKKPKFNPAIFLIPVIAYGLLAISYLQSALALGMPQLALVGSLFMLPQVVLNLGLYNLSRSASATSASATATARRTTGRTDAR